MYKNLVISSNKKIWSQKQKNLLVGNWCANNFHKFEKKDDYTLFNYHWNNKKKLKKDLKYLFKLYKFLINKLTKNLNSLHGVNYPTRYWEILISRWLWLYLVFFFDRWEIIRTINKKNKKLIAKLIKYKNEYFIPENTAEFTESNIFNDDWNHWVFSEILKFSTKIKLKYINSKKKKPKLKKYILKKNNFSKTISNLLLNKISSKKIFAQNLFYGKISENIFNISSGQLRNNLVFNKKFKNDKVNFNLREKFFKIKKKNSNDFEKFIILQIIKNLPKIYCENYIEGINFIEELKLPRKPKIIMTSLDHHFNDAFKLYTAKNILLGSKFYIFQHGGSYGTSDLYMTEKLDIRLSDKFFTWGWKEKNKKVKRFYCQRHYYVNPKIKRNSARKGIIIPITEMLLSPGNIASGRPRNKMEVNEYIEIINSFLMNINNDIKKVSAIKTLNNPSTNYVCKSLKYKFPNFNFIRSDQNTLGFLNKYKLYIETVNSTGYLESLRLNFPTILIFNNQICSIRKSAQKDMKLLKKVNILFDCPKKAANFVNKNYLNLDKWWNDKYLQTTRRKFCNKFARTSFNPYKDFKKFI